MSGPREDIECCIPERDLLCVFGPVLSWAFPLLLTVDDLSGETALDGLLDEAAARGFCVGMFVMNSSKFVIISFAI